MSHHGAAHENLRIVRMRRRARILDGDDVVSEVLDHPGPTDTLFDVLAACIAALAPGPRVAMLGFAAGGVVAPLRAMGFASPLRAVDLSLENVRLFRDMSQAWCGDVHVERDDAVSWLRRRRGAFDLILEDLAISSPDDAVKPEVSWSTLPQWVARRLQAKGVAVTNVLPLRGRSWQTLLTGVAAPFDTAYVVHLDEYVNRIVLTGALPSPRAVSKRIRAALASIGSTQTDRLSVRRLTR